MDEIYLDHAASTPVRPEVAALMIQVMADHPANPSSVHRAGQRARRVLESAREQAAAALGARPRTIIFNSGATEGINHALFSLASRAGFRRLLYSPLEHQAVLSVARELAARGFETVALEPEAGLITPASLRAAGTGPGDVVAVMQVNNETGTINPVRQLANAAHRAGATLFCDATQAFGVEPVDVAELNTDALVISGHKFGGPRGSGLLWLREGLVLAPYLHGGSQELGFRAGTSDVAAAAGLALAMELAASGQEQLHARLAQLQEQFETGLQDIPGVRVTGAGQPRSVKHTSVTVTEADGEALLMALDSLGVQVSVGSACSAGSLAPSHVLLELGLPEADARSTLRFSFGRTTTAEEVAEALQRLALAVERCRGFATVAV